MQVMTLPPSKFQRPKPRPKAKPAQRVVLSADEKARYEELAKQKDAADKNYMVHMPADRRKI
jgi:hypothetical protein